MEIRVTGVAEDAGLDPLWRALDEESTFMMLEPGERGAPAPPQKSYRVVALDGFEAVGIVEVHVRPWARTRHRGHLLVGVRESHQSRGIGRTLLGEAVVNARRVGLRKLELTVQASNARALRLYRSIGFETEGMRRRAMVVEGREVDELYMGLLL